MMRSEWTGGNGVPWTHVQHSVAYTVTFGINTQYGTAEQRMESEQQIVNTVYTQ